MSRALALALIVAASFSSTVARGQAPIDAAPAPVAAAAPAVVALPSPPVNPAASPADRPADGECTTTTTTTTRCTGAAAPYAAHAATPAPPMLLVPAAPPVALVAPVVLPSGWSLHQDPDGSWWRVRKKNGNSNVWVPGLTLWMVSYCGGTVAAVASGDLESTFPIVGAFVAAGLRDDSGAKIGWAADGLVQLGSFIMFVVGASMDGHKLERLPVALGPLLFRGGGNGVALSGHF